MIQERILLNGLSGANPLGFMAALGCGRLLSRLRPDAKLGWEKRGAWRPVITGTASFQECLELVMRAAQESAADEDISLKLGDNITVAPDVFRSFALEAALNPDWSKFAATFGSDALDDDKGRIQYTKLCFITGSGHQNFLETMRLLRERTTVEHLRRAMFEDMDPKDRGLSMRWDPADGKEYALQWANPGPEGVQSSWGAYRLAIEALPFFPAVPERYWLRTTGFVSMGRPQRVFFQWPVWNDPISMASVASIVAYDFDLDTGEFSPKMREIREMGVEEIFRSERVRIGEGANFKVSFRPASPVARD